MEGVGDFESSTYVTNKYSVRRRGVLLPINDGKVFQYSVESSFQQGRALSYCRNRKLKHVKMDLRHVNLLSTVTFSPVSNASFPNVAFQSSSFPGYLFSSICGYSEPVEIRSGTPLRPTIYTSYESVENGVWTVHVESKSFYNGTMTHHWIGTYKHYPRYPDSSYIVKKEYKEWVTGYPDYIHHSDEETNSVIWKEINTIPPLSLKGLLNSWIIEEARLYAYSLNPKTLQNLSSDCMDSFYGLVSNSVQYITELTELSNLAKPLMQIFSGHISPKTLSSAYLSYEYGLRLSAKDTQSYMIMMMRKRNQLLRGFSSCAARDRVSGWYYPERCEVSLTRCLNIYYEEPSSFIVQQADILRRAGFLPTLEMAWDFVPLSFILDWFVPIGTALSMFDKKGIFDSHSFIEHCWSDKLHYSLDASLFSLSLQGKILLTEYSRDVSPNAPRPTPRFDDLDLSHRQLRNGSAIFLQRW